MKEARFLYKCRKCGKIDNSLCCDPKMAMHIFHDCVVSGKSRMEVGMPVSIISTHTCNRTDMGVTDLIGYEIVGEED
jgi:hypothetical protein